MSRTPETPVDTAMACLRRGTIDTHWARTTVFSNAEAHAIMDKLNEQAATIATLRAELQKVADDLTAENEDAHKQITTLRAALQAAFEAGWIDGVESIDKYGEQHDTCEEAWERYQATLAADRSARDAK